MQHSCLLKISDNYDNFSPKERIMADFILENPTKVIYYTIDDFAHELNISEATVFRFVKHLGYIGYQYFKVELAGEISKVAKNATGKKSSMENAANPFMYMTDIYKRNVEKTAEEIDEDLILRIIQRIRKVKKVGIFGLGTASEAALHAYHKFIEANVACVFATDYHMQMRLADRLNNMDMAIVVCDATISQDTFELASVLKQNHVRLLGISNNPNGPFAKLVDENIYTYPVKPQNSLEKLSSHISQLSIIDYLYLKLVSTK